ncbi:hypothetical protein UlMin_004280 [Ulmus minor]
MGTFLCLFSSTLLLFFLCIVSFAVDDSISLLQSLGDEKTIVSSGGSFELGFFSPGSSNNRYLGIWYTNIPVRTVVWVANRCKPIKGSSGLLMINRTGNLVLLYQNMTVWSASTLKQAKEPKVRLLDTGNLVLIDAKETPEIYLWQSFDYPSDTLLPGMKLGWDLKKRLNRRLSAWKSFEDPCPANFTYGVELEPNKTPEVYIRKNETKYYRSGPWNGLRFSGVPEQMNNSLYDFNFVNNDDEAYYMYNLKGAFRIFVRVVLNQTRSSRERIVWLSQYNTWKLFSSYPVDNCDKYGFCGANGNCWNISGNSVCQCLQGFKPKSPEKWGSNKWSEGCIRNTQLSCQDKDRDAFVKVAGLKLPDTSFSWLNKSMDLMECKAKCLSNCSCMAYTNSDITGQGSGGCINWFGDLMDIRQFSSTDGQYLYIRMPASELEKGKLDHKVIAVIVLAVVGVASGMLLVGYCIWRRRMLIERNKMEEDLELPLFDLATIASATNNFSSTYKLGEGGFGPVYKGTLVDGKEIAVKRLSRSSGQGLTEFKNEVILIAKLQHRNLVKLIGCCIQGKENLLVYEYMPNKSLDFFIFDQIRGKLLDWSKRFQIILGIARGILYLHQDSRLRIIHRDLKASNVLLDSEMMPKISDFGMARICGGDLTEGNTNRVVGTYGYMAPEYASDGVFSVKSDVFSFGILVLEIITGKKNRGFFHADQTLNLAGHAWRLWKEGNVLELIDESLVGSYSDSEVLRCIHVSLLCVQQHPEDRPTMSSVVFMLGSQTALAQPDHPGFFIAKRTVEVNDSSSNQESSSATLNEVTFTVLEAR